MAGAWALALIYSSSSFRALLSERTVFIRASNSYHSRNEKYASRATFARPDYPVVDTHPARNPSSDQDLNILVTACAASICQATRNENRGYQGRAKKEIRKVLEGSSCPLAADRSRR